MLFNLASSFLSFALLVTSFGSASVLIPGTTGNSDILPPGYTMGDLRFKGSVNGIDNVDLNGTIQQIVAQLQVQHPGFTLNLTSPSNVTAAGLAARGALNKDGILCCPVAGHSWTWVQAHWIERGVDYLENFHGVCNVDGRSCVRISCEYGQAIFLCNDNDYEIFPDCGYIASYALDLIQSCSRDRGSSYPITCGQEFDSDNYNVVVAHQICSFDSNGGPDKGWKL